MTRDEMLAWVYEAATSARALEPREGAWINMPCPECEERGKSQRPTLGINMIEGWFNCFRCGTRGPCKGILDDTRMLTAVARDASAVEPAVESTPGGRPGLPHGFQALSDGVAGMEDGEKILEYVTSRGLSEQVVQESMLGWVPRGLYHGRVVVPVWTWNNWLGGFSARLVPGMTPLLHASVQAPMQAGRFLQALQASMKASKGQQLPILMMPTQEPKYRYPAGMDRDDVYLAAELELETDEPLLIVEGVFDALAYWPNAIALLGKPTETQIDRIAASAKRPLVAALDADAHRENMILQGSMARRRVPCGLLDLRRVGAHDVGEIRSDSDREEVRFLARIAAEEAVSG